MASIAPDAALRWTVVGLAITVGLMCSVIPYSLELISLRGLPPSTFAVLTSLSPGHRRFGWLVRTASAARMERLPRRSSSHDRQHRRDASAFLTTSVLSSLHGEVSQACS